MIDFVRCRYILEAYTKYNILENVRNRSAELINGLKKIDSLRNIRCKGLLVAFDFGTNKEQDHFARKAFENNLIFNKTRDKTIRLRPNLNVSSEEVRKAVEIVRNSVQL